MYLKELKFNGNPLCKCQHCLGKGVLTFNGLLKDIGIICDACNGRGYNEIPLSDEVKLYIDDSNCVIYKLVNGIVDEIVDLLNDLKVYVNKYIYVIHESTYREHFNCLPGTLTNLSNNLYKEQSYCIPTTLLNLFEKGIEVDEIFSYRDLINSYKPMHFTEDDNNDSDRQYTDYVERHDINLDVNKYEVTDNIIFFNHLNLGDKVKCYCEYCHGTGLIKQEDYLPDNIRVLCTQCYGRGYVYERLTNRYYILQDSVRNIKYFSQHDIIYKPVIFFERLKYISGVDYVMNSIHFDKDDMNYFGNHKELFKYGVSKDQMVSYHKFLEGRLPLPMEKYTCPHSVTLGEWSLGDCISYIEYKKCSKFGTGECWKMFYGDAKTAGEKQDVLKKLKLS